MMLMKATSRCYDQNFDSPCQKGITQLTIICSKSTIEKLEKGVKTVTDFILMFLLLTLNIFNTFF